MKEIIETMEKENKKCNSCFGASMNDCGSCEKETKSNKHDNINPDHYKERTSIECIDTMRIAFGDMDVAIYCIVNAYKYLWRHKYKNRLEDLKKAMWYLEKYTDLTNDKEWIKLPDEKAETIKELVKGALKEYGKSN